MAVTYLASNKIDVFPAGFRGTSYGKAKLTTEENLRKLTKITALKENRDCFIIDPDDNEYAILSIYSYIFRLKIVDIPSLPSGADKLYAFIKLRKVSEEENDQIGYVLGNVSKITDFDLDEGDSNSKFYGIGFDSSIPEGAYGIQIRDSEGLYYQTFQYSSTEIRDGSTNKTIAQQLTSQNIISDKGEFTTLYVEEVLMPKASIESTPLNLVERDSDSNINVSAVNKVKIQTLTTTTGFDGFEIYSGNSDETNAIGVDGRLEIKADGSIVSGKDKSNSNIHIGQDSTKLETKADTVISAETTISGKTTIKKAVNINAPLTVGEDSGATGGVTLKSSSTAVTTIIGPSNKTITLPENTTISNSVESIWLQKKDSSGVITNAWRSLSDAVIGSLKTGEGIKLVDGAITLDLEDANGKSF